MVRASVAIDRPLRARRKTRVGPHSKMSESRPDASRAPGVFMALTPEDPGRASKQALSAVDLDPLAGDIEAVLRHEEGDHGGHVLHPADPAERAHGVEVGRPLDPGGHP